MVRLGQVALARTKVKANAIKETGMRNERMLRSEKELGQEMNALCARPKSWLPERIAVTTRSTAIVICQMSPPSGTSEKNWPACKEMEVKTNAVAAI